MRQVLVIDDDPAVCATIIETLQAWPETKVMRAVDAVMAARTLRESHFDLALIDGSLPGVSGLQLAEVAANENTPVLLLVNCPDIDQTTASLGFPCLTKPFSISDLLLSSRDALAQASDNIARVKISTARLQATIEAVRVTMANSQKLLSKLNTWEVER